MKIFFIVFSAWYAHVFTNRNWHYSTNGFPGYKWDLRIRQISEEFDMNIAKDSILVIAKNGVVKRISAKSIIGAGLKICS